MNDIKTDKELLELAAKAVGYSVRKDLTYDRGVVINDGIVWNPLTDDEIMAINQTAEFDSAIGYARAIEAKVLEKLSSDNLHGIVKKFIEQNHVSCPEVCCEDRVYENAPNLVEELADIVGYYVYPEDE